ncbi:MAG: hypothetical protein Q4C88_02130 [Akkermansia sp.]|nr:hypothetical protein [Akkermansia sp.]
MKSRPLPQAAAATVSAASSSSCSAFMRLVSNLSPPRLAEARHSCTALTA